MAGVFDSYSLKARWYPAVLVSAPLLGCLGYVPQSALLGVGIPAAAAISVMVLIGEQVRSRGRVCEARLIDDWDGFPTTRALRLASSVPQDIRDLNRNAVARTSGFTLPTAEEELVNKRDADSRYDLAVKVCIAKLRADGSAYGLIREENANYGFRRNARAIRGWGLGVCVLAIIVNAALAISTGTYVLGVVTAAIQIALFLFWALGVKDIWVEEQADLFAERLLIQVRSQSNALVTET